MSPYLWNRYLKMVPLLKEIKNLKSVHSWCKWDGLIIRRLWWRHYRFGNRDIHKSSHNLMRHMNAILNFLYVTLWILQYLLRLDLTCLILIRCVTSKNKLALLHSVSKMYVSSHLLAGHLVEMQQAPHFIILIFLTHIKFYMRHKH